MRAPRSVITLLAIAAAALVPAAAPALSSKPKTVNASIRESGLNFSFRPHALSIRRGDSVRWRWCPGTGGCSAEHNVVGFLEGRTSFRHPRNASPTRGVSSGTYTHTFTRAGSYEVVCTIHGFSMTLTVR